MELRLGWDGISRETTPESGNGPWGAGDLSAGVKLHLRPEEGWVPEIAVLAGTTLPTGSDGFSSQRMDPSARLSFSHTFSERVGLGYNIGTTWESTLDDSSDRDTSAAMNYTAALGISLHQRLGVFIEAFGDLPLNAPGGAQHLVDGGFTVLAQKNLQVDVAAGRGISGDNNSWFLTTGLVLLMKR